MKGILVQLAEMKHQQEKEGRKMETPLDLSLFKKKIKKEEKMEKYLKKQRQQRDDGEEEEEPAVAAPKVNIFAVDNYESGVKTVIHSKNTDEMID